MILAVDAGNTRVKGALVGSSGVVPIFTLATASVPAEPWALSKVLETSGTKLRRVEGVVVCSVVPELDRPLSSALRRATGHPALFVRHTWRFPFRVGVAKPAKLGADRLCAAAGALGPRREHAIVVDIGSAVTVDLVTAREFRGGLIMPGPGLGLWALGNYARRLPKIAPRKVSARFPKRFNDTEPSMILGVQLGVVGAIAEAVRELRRVSGRSPSVFVTGGGARLVVGRLPRGWVWDPHLVSKGVYRVWRLNRVCPPATAGRADPTKKRP